MRRCPGVDPNVPDLRGELTPLYYAASAGSADAVRLLLEHGADHTVQIDGGSITEVIRDNIGADFDFVEFADKVRGHDQVAATTTKRHNHDEYKLLLQVKQVPVNQKIFNCCESGDVNGLRRLANENKTSKGSLDWNLNNGAMTPMQLACVHGHDK